MGYDTPGVLNQRSAALRVKNDRTGQQSHVLMDLLDLQTWSPLTRRLRCPPHMPQGSGCERDEGAVRISGQPPDHCSRSTSTSRPGERPTFPATQAW